MRTCGPDDAGRLTGRRYPDGSRVTFAHDALGQRTKMHDANGRTTYTHDDVGRLKTVTNPANKRISYVHDAVGQRRYMQEPEGGRFSYSWDDAGRISFLVNPQNERTSFTHDNAGRRAVERLANGTRASYSYDDANQILRLANIKSDSTTISSFDYKYDPVGNRSRVIESSGIRVTWSYDNKYQLTRERRGGANAYDITYGYDPAGNRKTQLEGGVRTTYVCDSANQLKYTEDNTGRTTYTFDANGNQQVQKTPAGALTTNTWDYENRLTKVVLPSGTRNTMGYDADGKRLQKQDSTGTAKFIWDGENILVETNSLDIAQAVYTLEPVTYGNLISQYRSALSSFFHFDGLGSTDRLTNSLGVVTDNYLYQAFGIAVTSSGVTVNPFRYVARLGYYFDVDLVEYNTRARHYSPYTGRFLACDPLQAILNFLNTYAYAGANPINSTDPSGQLDVVPVGQQLANLECKKPNDPQKRYPSIQWLFRLETKASGPGYFVQKVTYECYFDSCKDCNFEKKPKDRTGTITFWEIWPVNVDDKFWKENSANPPRATFTDRSSGFCLENSCGWVKATGEIRFYLQKDTGYLEGDPKWKPGQKYKKGPCETGPATWQHSTNDEQAANKFWNKGPVEKADRWFENTWYCCPCEPYCKADANPKSKKDQDPPAPPKPKK